MQNLLWNVQGNKDKQGKNQGGSGKNKWEKRERETEISGLLVPISPFKPLKHSAYKINLLAPNTSENTE